MLKVYQMRLVQSTAEVDAHQLEMVLLPVRMGRMQTQAAVRAKATFDVRVARTGETMLQCVQCTV